MRSTHLASVSFVMPGSLPPKRPPRKNAFLCSGYADVVLVSAGRKGATDGLKLETAGLNADEHGKIAVNRHYQTRASHIYAVGDVIGAPQLASTSAEQGRLAACHAFGVPAACLPHLYPFGIYAIPEIAWVGCTEHALTTKGIPFETGVARYAEIEGVKSSATETGP